MKDTDFTKLLTSCVKAAEKHFRLVTEVNDECRRRYGCSYSDLDVDQLIDALDILGADKLTATEFDKAMKTCGAQRVDN